MDDYGRDIVESLEMIMAVAEELRALAQLDLHAEMLHIACKAIVDNVILEIGEKERELADLREALRQTSGSAGLEKPDGWV